MSIYPAPFALVDRKCFECCTGSPSFVARMREAEDMYRSLSHEMTLDEWKTRPLPKRWVDNVMRLTSGVQ